MDEKTITQILQHTRKDGIVTKLDEAIAMVEEEFEVNQTNGLFRKWLIEDKQAQEIIVRMKDIDETKGSWLKKNFLYEDGLLYKKSLIQPSRHGINTTAYREKSIYVPNAVGVRETIMRNYHGAFAATHPGTTEFIYKVRSCYYWPGMYDNCKRWVKGCDLCATRKVTHSVRTV